MVITFRDFTKITFPAFLMDSGNWEIVDGVFFCDGKVVDDRNQMGVNIGARRMQSPLKNKYELKKSVAAPNGLMKQSTNTSKHNLCLNNFSLNFRIQQHFPRPNIYNLGPTQFF